MIEVTLTMMAALVAAIGWIIYQEMTLRATRKRLEGAKRAVEVVASENEFLKDVLTDVAKGEAHVWFEDGEVRAARAAAGKASIH